MAAEQLFVTMALFAWETQSRRTSELLNSLSDEQLTREVAPGKNRVIYLMGHLTAVHDAMNDILGLGNRAHADLDEAFLKNPDKSGLPIPEPHVLKQYWNDVHQDLDNKLRQLAPEEWFKRHNAMTDEAFEKDPTRNKLSVLLNRTNHLAYHFGQIRLVK